MLKQADNPNLISIRPVFAAGQVVSRNLSNGGPSEPNIGSWVNLHFLIIRLYLSREQTPFDDVHSGEPVKTGRSSGILALELFAWLSAKQTGVTHLVS